MITRRLATVGLAVFVSLGLAATGCETGGTSDPPPSAAKSATEILTEAAAKTKGQSFKYTMTYGTMISGDGAQDADRNVVSNMTIAEPTTGLTIKMNALVVGADMYLKLDMGPLGANLPGLSGIDGKWMHIDTEKAKTGLAGGLTSDDGAGPDSYIKGVVSAEKVSDTEIKGTIDLAKAAPFAVSQSEVSQLDATQRNVPFVVILDSEGRIAKITITMPKVGLAEAADVVTTYSGYGASVEIEKPDPAEVIEAPALIYQFLQ